MCGRRFGKSLVSQIMSIGGAIKGKKIAYITPTYSLSKVFFDDMLKMLVGIPCELNKSDLVIKINGGVIRFFTGERLDNLRGLKFHKTIIDEASYIPDLKEGWQNSIRPTLTDYKGKAVFLSTPKGSNFFYSLYLKGMNGEKDWESFKYSTYDNPYIDVQEIEDAKSQLPKAVFEQEYMANPMENAANPFGSQFIKQCTYPISNNEAICYGIDLAKSVDWTVIIGLDANGAVCHLQRFQKDWRQTIDTIMLLPKDKPIAIDSTGVGDPIAEELQRSFHLMESVKFTSTSKQQMMEALVTAIQQSKLRYPEGVIPLELEQFEYQYTSTGVKYSAPSGFHDDAVMSLALAWKMYIPSLHYGNVSVW